MRICVVIQQISALRSCAKLLSSAMNNDSSDLLKHTAAADYESSPPSTRLDRSMYYGGSRAVLGKSLLRCELRLLPLSAFSSF